MRFSENRPVAWGILALVALLSISLSGGKAMNDTRSAAEKMFFGTGGGGNINHDLDTRATESYKLASIASKYISDGDEALSKVKDLSQQLQDAKTIDARYAANKDLSSAVEDLYSKVQAAGLSEGDQDDALRAYKDVTAKADSIGRDPYSDEARKFNESIAKFPANIIAGFTGVRELQTFK